MNNVSININDESEESQTLEILDILEDNDSDDAKKIFYIENDEFIFINIELFQFL